MSGDIKTTITDYFAIEAELKNAAKSMKLLREKKKELSNKILLFLRTNNKTRVRTKNGVLERKIRSKKVAVNKDHMAHIASQLGYNEVAVQSLVKAVYDNRPAQEVEVLTNGKGGAGDDAEESGAS
jgi:vacuolar-type H+-ATPase subunit D/Vma8